jgi:hypothetical protein
MSEGIYSNIDEFSTIESDCDFEAAAARVPLPGSATMLNRSSLDSFDETIHMRDDITKKSKRISRNMEKIKKRLSRNAERIKKRLSRKDSTGLYDLATKKISDPALKRRPPPPLPSDSSRAVRTCKCVAITSFLLGLLSAAGLLAYFMYGPEILCFFGLSGCKGNTYLTKPKMKIKFIT